MILRLVTLLIFLSRSLCLFTPEETIGHILKSTLMNKTSSQVTQMMKQHLQQMQLYSKHNTWAHPRLQAIGHYLLPQNLAGHHLARLVDKMAENAAKNKYLHHFLLQAEGPDFAELIEKVETEGARVFPDVVSYAMVLERLISAMRNDWRVLEACKDIQTDLLNPANIITTNLRNKRSVIQVFLLAKTVSVYHVVEYFLKALKDGAVDPNYSQHELPLNILEAKLVDISLGNLRNAKVALTLAKEAPGGAENACTGSGPARISPDGNAINFRMAFPSLWADLYQTWNMAFVTVFEKWPYYLAKLLIPSISGYHGNPGSYMYSRVLGLYSHINWGLTGNLYGHADCSDINWYSPSLTRNWGRNNLKSARDYEVQRFQCP